MAASLRFVNNDAPIVNCATRFCVARFLEEPRQRAPTRRGSFYLGLAASFRRRSTLTSCWRVAT